MNVKVTWIARLAAAAIALAALPAFAQEMNRDFELERLQLNPSSNGALSVWDGTLMTPGSLRVGAAGHYEQAPLVLHRPDGFPFGILVKERATIHVTAAYTVHEWVEVVAQVPWVFYSNGEATAGLEVPRGKQLGTPWVAVRAPILRRGILPIPVNVGAEVGVGIPVGTRGTYTNPRGAMLAPRLNAGFTFGQIIGALELSALFRPEASLQDFSGSLFDRAANTWSAALMVTTGGTGARVEVTGRYARNFFAPGWGAELMAGVRLPLSPIGPEVFMEAGPGAGNLLGQPGFRVFAGLAFGSSRKVLGGPETVQSPTLPLPPPKAPAPAVIEPIPDEPEGSTAPETPASPEAPATPAAPAEPAPTTPAPGSAPAPGATPAPAPPRP